MENSDIFARERLLIGDEGLQKLKNAYVFIIGLGGVGSYAAEAIARAGVGHIFLADGDKIEASNINRQLYALNSTIGKEKTIVAYERISDINPECKVEYITKFFKEDDLKDVNLCRYNYIIDAVDDVKFKVALAKYCDENGYPLISSMGTGNKTDGQFVVMDIYKTSNCPLAKKMRHELNKAGVEKLKVVYCPEKSENQDIKRADKTVSSISYMPPMAGLLCAKEALLHILKN